MYVPLERQKVRKRWKPLLEKSLPSLQLSLPYWLHSCMVGVVLFFLLLTLGFPGDNLMNGMEQQVRYGKSIESHFALPGEEVSANGQTQYAAVEWNPSHETSTWELDRYRVQQGDKIGLIAHNYGLNPWTLISLNQLRGPDDLFPGRILKVPPYDGMRISLSRRESPEDYATDNQISSEDMLFLGIDRAYFIPKLEDRSSYWDHSMIFPLTGEIIKPYGNFRDSLTGVDSFHGGINLSAPSNSPVAAVERGRVIKRGVHSYFGKYMILSHPGGFQSFYAHLDSFEIAQGQSIRKGDIIGFSGNSGQVEIPQLHFALFIDEKVVDPMEYLF